jgi:membrane associated rhomboid family serine protease
MNVREMGIGGSIPPVIKNLLIINGLVWLAQITIHSEAFDIENLFALHNFKSPLYKPWQIFTYMFLHDPGGFTHILFNMFALWMFGSTLEKLWGSQRFLMFYLVCGLGAGLVQMGAMWFDLNQTYHAFTLGKATQEDVMKAVFSSALGASGAVMGIFAAFAYTFPNTELLIIPIPIPIKAKWAMIGMIALDLFGGFSNQNSGVAHFAHVGGAAIGLLIIIIWNKKNRRGFY